MDITNLKPSELIRVALNDLELCEKDAKYNVYMEAWHEPFDQNSDSPGCFVCLAGAVIAQSLNTPINFDRSPENFSLPISIRLRVLNLLREGDIPHALALFSDSQRDFDGDYYFNSPVADREITSYSINTRLFKADMLRLADDLEDVGY